MKLLIFTILFSAIHFTWAGNRVKDLFKKSKRKNKTQWMLFILLVPVVGAMVYNLTMKRKKYINIIG
jgi:predicted permease